MSLETIVMTCVLVGFSILFTYTVYRVARRMNEDLIDNMDTINSRIDTMCDKNDEKLANRIEEVYRSIDNVYRESEKSSARNGLIQELEACDDKKNIRSIVEKYM